MANVPNKDESHHRSRTQLNKHKQAFLHRHSHVLYIHKLDPNLAGDSHVLLFSSRSPTTGKNAAVFLVRKRSTGRNNNRARHTIISEPPPTQQPSVALIVRRLREKSRPNQFERKNEILIHGRVVVHIHTAELMTVDTQHNNWDRVA